MKNTLSRAHAHAQAHIHEDTNLSQLEIEVKNFQMAYLANLHL